MSDTLEDVLGRAFNKALRVGELWVDYGVRRQEVEVAGRLAEIQAQAWRAQQPVVDPSVPSWVSVDPAATRSSVDQWMPLILLAGGAAVVVIALRNS